MRGQLQEQSVTLTKKVTNSYVHMHGPEVEREAEKIKVMKFVNAMHTLKEIPCNYDTLILLLNDSKLCISIYEPELKPYSYNVASWALLYGKREFFKIIISALPDLMFKKYQELAPLEVAVMKQDDATVAYILSRSALYTKGCYIEVRRERTILNSIELAKKVCKSKNIMSLLEYPINKALPFDIGITETARNACVLIQNSEYYNEGFKKRCLLTPFSEYTKKPILSPTLPEYYSNECATEGKYVITSMDKVRFHGFAYKASWTICALVSKNLEVHKLYKYKHSILSTAIVVQHDGILSFYGKSPEGYTEELHGFKLEDFLSGPPDIQRFC